MKQKVIYPLIDRSDRKPKTQKKDADDDIDIHQSENVFSDGRPYREESWAAYQTTYLTYYFSTLDIEDYSPNRLKDYLVSEGVIEFYDDKFHKWGYQGGNLSCRKSIDKNDNEFWECTVIIGDEDALYARDFSRKEIQSNKSKYQEDTEEQIWFKYINEICQELANKIKWQLQRIGRNYVCRFRMNILFFGKDM